MEQAANRLGLRELVVKRHSMLGRQYVHRNLPFLQKIQRLAWHVKALGHSTKSTTTFEPCSSNSYINILCKEASKRGA